jgi:hypothetical protein
LQSRCGYRARRLRGDNPESQLVAFRDATLAAPRLLLPSLQVNICAGRLPAPDAKGRVFLRLPISAQI